MIVIGEKIAKLLEYENEGTFSYLARIINFFYSEFDVLTPEEKDALYMEIERVRKNLNTPKITKRKIPDRGTVDIISTPDIIEKEDVHPPIYARYEEHLKTQTKNIEERRTKNAPRIIEFLKTFFYTLKIKFETTNSSSL